MTAQRHVRHCDCENSMLGWESLTLNADQTERRVALLSEALQGSAAYARGWKQGPNPKREDLQQQQRPCAICDDAVYSGLERVHHCVLLHSPVLRWLL